MIDLRTCSRRYFPRHQPDLQGHRNRHKRRTPRFARAELSDGGSHRTRIFVCQQNIITKRKAIEIIGFFLFLFFALSPCSSKFALFSSRCGRRPEGGRGRERDRCLPGRKRTQVRSGQCFFFFPGKKMMQGITKNKAPSSSFSVQTNFFNF